ncbi:zinc ABC transporter substrate-binding protein [Clostridium sp. D2Q-14]|uniref:metal ABC transporter solute-binding protein, Zn/Mn family n=1 Tax=Anaeromonas gelatinilytica TaxID=2683194 RepID=UPI00193BE4E6|nr:zinc ABC transporter substrate-binding protein [Anaeromonas gelatinilytica]MBS4535747.1 zinc ABC transporter substrate-binding protein [Anaeromonas gelatinilytica]
MKKSILIIMLITLIVLFTACSDGEEAQKDEQNKLTVGVTIPPVESFVKEIAGDKIEVVTMIPPGNSPANYQPTPKQMTQLSDADIYFSVEVPAESNNILPQLDDYNKNMKVVNVSDLVSEVYPARYFDEEEEHSHGEDEEHSHGENEDHDHEGMDPHIWMSPKRVKEIVEIIKDELMDLDPDNEEFYRDNAEEYLAELDQLDEEIKESLEGSNKQSFIIYHPSMGYFADDYGLEMVAIEESGKEASAKKLKEVIDFAKKEDIKFVFYQEEFDKSQADTISKEIDGAAISIDVLSEDYINSMKEIAGKFEEVLQ